jgi:hypothetical protein
MPKPSSMRPTMSIATLTAAALTAAPAKKSAPPASMTACLPIALVTRLATREAAVRDYWCLGSFPKSLEYQSVSKILR